MMGAKKSAKRYIAHQRCSELGARKEAQTRRKDSVMGYWDEGKGLIGPQKVPYLSPRGGEAYYLI